LPVEDIITMRLAGQAGEMRYSFGWSGPSYNVSPDDEDVAEALVLGERIARTYADAVVTGAWERLIELIDGGTIWPAIEVVAAGLLQQGKLTGEEIAEVIAVA
jgi:hypothetical protein